MEVKWHNIICFALVMLALFMLIHSREEVAALLQALGNLGPEHSTDEKIWGLIVFGLVSFTLLGVLITLMRNGS